MIEQRLTVATDDDLLLDVVVAGASDGRPVLFHTGTPMAGLPFDRHVEAAEARGLRLVHYSRPGYASSTRSPGRSVADCVGDVLRICDHLGIDRFLTVGWSGGGPHALACAALAPDRVGAAATIAGVAPYPADGLDWMAGMAPENVEEFTLALENHDGLQTFMRAWEDATDEATPAGLIKEFGGLVSDVDKQTLSMGLAEYLLEATRRSFADGIWGWFDDDLAFTRDWGFDIDAIRVRVTVWQGAQDRFVPFAHGRWLAEHVPGAKAELSHDHGHLSLAVDSFPDILDELARSE